MAKETMKSKKLSKEEQQTIEAILQRKAQAEAKAQQYQTYANYAQVVFNSIMRKYAGKYELEGNEFEYKKGRIKAVKPNKK